MTVLDAGQAQCWVAASGCGGGPGIPKRPSTDDEVIRGHDYRVWNPCAPWPLVL